jgi:undecaprenyl diphosphate synthase
MAYTELYFTEVNWPDFTVQELHKALNDFRQRERRYGLTSDQLRQG